MDRVIKRLILCLLFLTTPIVLFAAHAHQDVTITREPPVAWEQANETRLQDDTRLVETANTAALEQHGFEAVSENDRLKLYVQKDVFNIAVYDQAADYVWYGFYPDYVDHGYTERLNQLIRSGITIDYFDAQTLNEATMSLGHADAGTQTRYITVADGLDVEINMVRLGISFTVELRLEAASLVMRVPDESIEEVPFQTAAMRVPREMRLRAIYLFPYFGSGNHEINGYALIPDGSGALINYTDTVHRSAYIRRVFGRDIGIQSMRTTQTHLRPEETIQLPLFGINHGYEQAAFLAEAVSGFGALELHSYPHGYNNTRINTTFFAFLVRDRTLIQMSGQPEGLAIINQKPYPNDMMLRYTFLKGAQANYAGMAQTAKDSLTGLYSAGIDADGVKLHIEALGIDYKPGLLGRTFVPLTSYQSVMDIYDRLQAHGIAHQAWVYRGYNRGGYYGETPIRPRADRRLGGRSDFSRLLEWFAEDPKSHLALVDNPLVVHQRSLFTRVLQRTSLDLLSVPVDGLLVDHGYYRPIEGFASGLLGRQGLPRDVQAVALDTVGSSHFSYRLSGDTVYREKMIAQIVTELTRLDGYEVGLYQPAGYTFPYLSRYYDLSLDSNRLTYFTRTVPFVSLMLHGHIELYGPFINYINDVDALALRLIEYGAWPAALITEAPSYQLRFTNYEALMTTEFALWETEIVTLYQRVATVLQAVVGVPMLNHRVLADDVVAVTYDNGVVIIVNYSAEAFEDAMGLVPAHSAKVVKP